MKAEEFHVAIDRDSDAQKDAFVRQVHLAAVIQVGAVTGSYGAAQMALAQECIGSMFALSPDAARMLVGAWLAELNGGPQDLAVENEAIRRLVAAEEVHRAGRRQ